MPTGLKRFYGGGHLHFITCSCYRRKPLLDSPQNRELFLKILEEVRQKYGFVVVGYVVMPEHFHLLMDEPEYAHFWETRFYDFNVWTTRKRIEKLRYMHRNPVKRGLVTAPELWAWSSFQSYASGESERVLVNQQKAARLTKRVIPN
jgi:putative transposase